MRSLLPLWSEFVLFERARGGREGGSEHMRMEAWAAFRIHNRLKMPGSSEEDRPLVDPCISRPPPRCYDPDPLRSLLAAYFFSEILETFLKGRRGGASGHISGGCCRTKSENLAVATAIATAGSLRRRRLHSRSLRPPSESVEPPLDLIN
jgi:hypothetical protein